MSPHCPLLPALLPDLGEPQGAGGAGRPLRLPDRPGDRGLCEARPAAAADIRHQTEEKTAVGLLNENLWILFGFFTFS